MNPLSTVERIGLAAAAGALLLGSLLTWWHVHNLNEQHAGAQACLQASTETKTDVIADNAAGAGAQAVDLQLVVKTYDDKVKSLAADNADLARRLHNGQVRQSAAANPGSAAAGAGCAIFLPAAQSDARAAAIEVATKKIFDDCDADYAGRLAVIDAYNKNRERTIAEAAARK